MTLGAEPAAERVVGGRLGRRTTDPAAERVVGGRLGRRTTDTPIQVRIHSDSAVIRYRPSIEVAVGGTRIRGRSLHTDYHEKRDAGCQIV